MGGVKQQNNDLRRAPRARSGSSSGQEREEREREGEREEGREGKRREPLSFKWWRSNV